MLQFLPSFLVGTIAITLYLLNGIIFPILIIVFGVLRLLLPFSFWRHSMDWMIHNFAETSWVQGNKFIMRLTVKTKIEVQGTGDLRRDGQYFLLCNHQSWTDILVLENIFVRRIPILKFFMKKQLLWSLPIIGLSCWFAGYPFMQRHRKSYLKKHPEKKGQDLATTKKLCERFINHPLTVTGFLEGTRFTPAKKLQQRSPYKHLLKPKMTSFAFVLTALEKSLHDIVNTTIVYPEGKISLWDFVCGRINKIIVRYEVIPISKELHGDYKDREYRARLQTWLNQLWQEKDTLLDKYMDKIEKSS